jgi:general secretion pathway protein K
MVLVMVLMAVAILVAAAVEGHRKVRFAMGSAGTTRDLRQLGWIAASGIELAKALLVEDKRVTKTDTVQEIWADEAEVAKVLDAVPFENGSLELSISDILGKIQINALVKPPKGQQFDDNQKNLWDRFLRPILELDEDADPNSTTDLINCMKDWMDKEDDDAITGINGAETDYYEDLEPPYSCRNGTVDHKDQLLLVKGMTRELYYGQDGLPGISEYITEYGAEGGRQGGTFPGKVNIGTCPLPVMQALVQVENRDLAGAIIAYRGEKDGAGFVNDVSQAGWYKNAPGCGDVEIPADLVTTGSNWFEVRAKAVSGTLTRSVVAVLYREKDNSTGLWTCRVLSCRVL